MSAVREPYPQTLRDARKSIGNLPSDYSIFPAKALTDSPLQISRVRLFEWESIPGDAWPRRLGHVALAVECDSFR
jgi:hypothetical protein